MTTTRPLTGHSTPAPSSTGFSEAPIPAPGVSRPLGQSALALALFLAIVGLVAAFGSITSANAIDGWYAATPKPMWNPPNAIFGPVWAVLYLSMAIAAWLIWRRPDSVERTGALRAYVVQLAINAVWIPAFFGLGTLMGAPGVWVALGVLVALGIAILAAIIRFADIDRTAAALLVPYWFWVLFATTLNAAIAVLAS